MSATTTAARVTFPRLVGAETALAHGSKSLMASRVLDALRPLLAPADRPKSG